MTDQLLQATPFMHVADVDAATAFIAPHAERPSKRDTTLPARNVHGHADTPHGQCELPVLAHGGDLACFGHALFDARTEVPPP